MLVLKYVEMGHEVTLCANKKSKVPCRLIGWRGHYSQHFRDTLKNSFQLSSLVLKEKFDVIHSFSRLAYMVPIMPLNIKKIMSYQREPSLRQIKRAISISRKRTMHFTGCSDYIANQVRKITPCATIYNGLLIEKYEFVASVSINAPLVFLGRIEEIKGPHIAIDIAKKSGKKLIIAGNVPHEKTAYFKSVIQPELSEQIVYVGAVGDAQKNKLLGEAEALIMPIQWNEPFGIVMIEAMACGTPVIGFNKGAVNEVVINEVNGFVCDTFDIMLNAVQRCKNINRSRVRQTVEDIFSADRIARDYLSLYASL